MLLFLVGGLVKPVPWTLNARQEYTLDWMSVHPLAFVVLFNLFLIKASKYSITFFPFSTGSWKVRFLWIPCVAW